MFIIDLFTIAVIIGFAFIVVAAEIALLQIKKSDINESNAYVQKMIQQKNEFMSTIQVGITISSMLAGYAGEPAMTRIIMLTGLQHLVGEKITSTIAFAFVTIISIILSELLPKNIAMAYPKETLLKVIVPIKIIHTLFYPVVWILNESSSAITRWLHIPLNPDNELINQASLISSMKSAAISEESDIADIDVKLVQNVIRLNEIPVSQILTPIDKISYDNQKYSRTPLSQELISYNHQGTIHKFKTITNLATADQALSQMSKKHTGILAVTDNQKPIGIITNTDIFQLIYPELFDEKTSSQRNQ